MLQIITTGGTIEGLDYIGNKGTTESNVSIERFLLNANVDFEYVIEHLFKKDSRAITEKDLKSIAAKIRALKVSRILITHGTYTMARTAKYLGQLKLDKTIILVGSFILGSEKNSDASFNLGYAISSFHHLRPDVYIVMNGKVFHHSNVKKNLIQNKFTTED